MLFLDVFKHDDFSIYFQPRSKLIINSINAKKNSRNQPKRPGSISYGWDAGKGAIEKDGEQGEPTDVDREDPDETIVSRYPFAQQIALGFGSFVRDHNTDAIRSRRGRRSKQWRRAAMEERTGGGIQWR